MRHLGIELAVELPARTRLARDLRVGAGRPKRRPHGQDHRLSVQVHRLLLLFGCIFRAAPEHPSSGCPPALPMFLHVEPKTRNICAGTYPSIVALSTK